MTSELRAGHFYTMGTMKHPCGDRSWTHDIWEVIETNDTHAVIRALSAKADYSFGFEPMVVLIRDFDWVPAEGLAKALSEYVCPRVPNA